MTTVQTIRSLTRSFSRFVACLAIATSIAIVQPRPVAAAAADASPTVAPNNAGAWKVVSASWIGADGHDDVVSADIAPDGTILLAGNASKLDWGAKMTTVIGQDRAPVNPSPPDDPKSKASHDPSAFGFIAHLSADGTKPLHLTRFGRGAATLIRMKLDAKGNVCILGESKPAGNAAAGAKAAAGAESGAFIATITPDGKTVHPPIGHDGLTDFGIDTNGDIVALSKGHMIRFGPDGRQKWDVTWPTHGDNRPGGMNISPKSGVAVVVGYGMTKTGHEPYKDPYAYGFDRDGKQVWSLWNPDPTKEADGKFGGNGLMADTTGRAVGVSAGAGDVYLMLYADGGNTICTRDPQDPFKPLAASVFEGVFQKGAGFGFKGASKTSVIFRVDGATGEIKKGTWMCAWPTKSRANSLSIVGAVDDGAGHTFVVGNSASGCPTKDPWYESPEGGYKGGGFLAIFDGEFKLLQCGYFPGSTINCVAERSGTVVIAGNAKKENKSADPNNPSAAAITYPVPALQPLQSTFGGGSDDGYFVVLKGK